MDPQIENLVAGMPDADRQQLASDMGAWAAEHGVELTEQITEDYIRGAYTADQAAEAEPPELTREQAMFAGYAENHRRAEQQAEVAALAVEQAQRDAQQFEAQIGRTLTGDERDRLAEAQIAQVFRGQQLDVHGAATEAGIKSWSDMSEREVAEAMTERIAELSDPEPDLEVPVRHSPFTGQREVDWAEMTDAEANQYMAARLGGATLGED